MAATQPLLAALMGDPSLWGLAKVLAVGLGSLRLILPTVATLLAGPQG